MAKLRSALPFAPSAVAGVVSLYNLLRSFGYTNNAERELQKGKPATDSQIKTLTKGMKNVVILRDPQDAKLLSKSGKGIQRFAAKILRENNNAFAGQTRNGTVLIIPRKVSFEVAAHEVGHLRDFAEKKIKLERKDPHYHTDSLWHATGRMLWKPKFTKDIIGLEENAWKYVPENRRKKELKDHAIRSYNQSYHQNRAFLSGFLGAILASGAMGAKTLVKAGLRP